MVHLAHLSDYALGSSVVVHRYRAFCSCGFATEASQRLADVVAELDGHAVDVDMACPCWKGA